MERLTQDHLNHLEVTFKLLKQNLEFTLNDSVPSTLTVYHQRALNDCIMVLTAVAELRVWRALCPRAPMGDFTQN